MGQEVAILAVFLRLDRHRARPARPPAPPEPRHDPLRRCRRAPIRPQSPHGFAPARPRTDVRRGTRILVIAAAGLGLAGAAVWVARPKPVPPPDWAGGYDLAAKPPERIAPGT